MFRVRSLRDLERHLGPEVSTKVLVAEKGSLPARPGLELLDPKTPLPAPEQFFSIAARGEISLDRARRRGGFSLSPAGAERLAGLAATLNIPPHLGDQEMVLERFRTRTAALVELHGEHRVLAELSRFSSRAGDRLVAPGLLLAVTEESLASRDHAERLYRGYERDTSAKRGKVAASVEVVPSKPLASLNPKKGTLAGASLQVRLPDTEAASAHLLARLATRGYGVLGPSDALAALAPSASPSAARARLPETSAKLADLASTLQPRLAALLAEGVFASGVVDPPVDDKMLTRLAGSGSAKPVLASNRVRVTVPSPVSPSDSLTFVLEVTETRFVDRGGVRRPVATVVPVTVLSPVRLDDGDDTEPLPFLPRPARERLGVRHDPPPGRPLDRFEKTQRMRETDEILTGNERRFLDRLGVRPPTARPQSSNRPGPRPR